MHIEHDVQLKTFNTFGLPALAPTLIRVRSEADLLAVVRHPQYGPAAKGVLGGGSNIVLCGAMPKVLLKVELPGRRLVREDAHECVIEAGAGENWPELVAWTMENGWPGLENLGLIPGTVGAAPIQNIGAYGLELKDRFLSLEAVDLTDGRSFRLSAAECRFGYRDSIFKHELAGRCVITRVHLRLPRPWRPVLEYPDLGRLRGQALAHLSPQEIYEAVCALRRAKLPDPGLLGNAGSFFKNPVLDSTRHAALQAFDPRIPSFPTSDGRFKLSAGWLIEACGWKGRRLGQVGVFERQALVLVNYGGASGREVMDLAEAIQQSVQQRFGIRLEMEPTLI